MSVEPPIEAVLVAGPTASGKSALALALAERLGGAVVNADASQVYLDLRVLSARPDDADERRAPHRLYGHVDGADPYAVGRWLSEIRPLLPRTPGEPPPLLPVIVGGTGLYLEALTRGLAPAPAIPPEIRARWRSADPAGLHAELARRDPLMASRVRPSDPQRLARAIEVIEATGVSLADWQARTPAGPLDPARTLRIVLSVERPALHERIAARLERMIAGGAREEAERLAARDLDPALPVMKALGVQPFAAWARGAIGRDEAVARTALDTRRYAKRQSTWFRNRMADWIHTAPETALDVALAEIARRGHAPGA